MDDIDLALADLRQSALEIVRARLKSAFHQNGVEKPDAVAKVTTGGDDPDVQSEQKSAIELETKREATIRIGETTTGHLKADFDRLETLPNERESSRPSGTTGANWQSEDGTPDIINDVSVSEKEVSRQSPLQWLLSKLRKAVRRYPLNP